MQEHYQAAICRWNLRAWCSRRWWWITKGQRGVEQRAVEQRGAEQKGTQEKEMQEMEVKGQQEGLVQKQLGLKLKELKRKKE